MCVSTLVSVSASTQVCSAALDKSADKPHTKLAVWKSMQFPVSKADGLTIQYYGSKWCEAKHMTCSFWLTARFPMAWLARLHPVSTRWAHAVA